MEEFSGFLYGKRVGSNAVIKGVVTYGEKKIRGVNDVPECKSKEASHPAAPERHP